MEQSEFRKLGINVGDVMLLKYQWGVWSGVAVGVCSQIELSEPPRFDDAIYLSNCLREEQKPGEECNPMPYSISRIIAAKRLGGLEELCSYSGIEQPVARGVADKDIPLDELELEMRAYHCMQKVGLHSARVIAERTPNFLLRTKNFGRHSLENVRDVLAAHGFYLRPKVPGTLPWYEERLPPRPR